MMTADWIWITSQTGQQSSAEEEEGDDGEA